MQIKWGDTVLSVSIGTWSPMQTAPVLSEVELLPDPENPNAVCTVLQQRGRKRSRAAGNVIVTSMSEYAALCNNLLHGISRTLTDGDTLNGTFYIESLGNPVIHFAGHITVDIIFVEG